VKLDKISGKAWLFGDNINTDQIIQGRYLTMLDYTQMAKHAFEIPRPEFASQVKRGDIIIGGRNFGGGSSREEAPQVLKTLGVGCIIAESFARIFYRNGFNIGLPLIIMPDVTSKVQDGTQLVVNLYTGIIENEDTNETIQAESLPQHMLDFLKAGGAVKLFLQQSLKINKS
jgi:3-isopropylmalate/(R)-2-methylmalate dehydratase small subunit